ncbi:hypothetical protein AVEN_54115-1 [Araneus ventricosus]|uniref:Uncharacterized protein n=1 Tax=Araneus ventricosus TaxID=182803 RepID=A0A4Y2BTH3_ARAVE|nr:hypothetical protein AVEN_54115-1 [Araneus ventricosus]
MQKRGRDVDEVFVASDDGKTQTVDSYLMYWKLADLFQFTDRLAYTVSTKVLLPHINLRTETTIARNLVSGYSKVTMRPTLLGVESAQEYSAITIHWLNLVLETVRQIS